MAVESSDNCNLQTLIDKLDHSIDEIKCRALTNIASKIHRGLFTPDALTAPILVKKLLDWLEKHPLQNTHDVLRILLVLIKKEQVRQKLVFAGGISILTRVRNQLPSEELRDVIDEIFGYISEGDINGNGFVNPSACQNPQHSCGYFNFSGSSILTSSSALSSNQGRNRGLQPNSSAFESSQPWSQSNVNNCISFGKTPQSSSTSATPTRTKHQILSFPKVCLTKTDTDVLRASISSMKSADTEVALAGVTFFQDVILEDFPAEIFIQRPQFIEVLFGLLASRKHQLMFATVDVLICLVEKLINRVYFHLDPNNYSSFDGSFNSESSSTNLSVNQRLSTEVPRVSIENPVADPSTIIGLGHGRTSHCSILDPHSGELQIPLKACDRPGNFTLPEFGMELVRITGCLLRQLVEAHLQSTSKSTSGETDSTPRTTNLQGLRYKGEAQLLRLVRLAIRLILTSLLPVELTKSAERPQCQADTVSHGFSWLLSCGPPKEDAIPPSELPRNFVTSLEPWGPLLDSLAFPWSQVTSHETGSCTDWSASDLTARIAAASLPNEYERHIYLAVLSTLFHFMCHLQDLALSVLPTELRNAFSLALLETRLVHSVSDDSVDDFLYQHGLPAYVLLFNTGIYTTWQLLIRLERSMINLVTFITELEDFDDSGDLKKISLSTLNFAVQGVDSLSILGSNRFASEFVRFVNELSLRNLFSSPTSLWQSQLVLLRLLSHSLPTVRKAAYSSLVAIVRHATDPNVVADPSQPPNGLSFLLHEEVLCECIEFGLRDELPEIQSLSEQLLACLFNSYEFIPESSWRTLYRLCMDPISGSIVSFRSRPLSILLGSHASVTNQNAHTPSFGQIALDWCLGCMSLTGRCPPLQTDGLRSSESLEANHNIGAFHSCCRLLMHPCAEVRVSAATVVARFFHQFLSCQLSHSDRQVEGCSSGANDVRQITEVSTATDHNERANTKDTRQTSTPMDSTTFEAALIQDLTDCLIGPQGSSSADNRSGILPLLDHSDNMCSDSINVEKMDGLLRVMQLFADHHADLGVRRAAGEQVLIMIKHAAALTTWLENGGLVHACQWISDMTSKSVTSSAHRTSSPECFASIQTSPDSPTCCVLLPLHVRLLRFGAIWSSSVREQLASDGDFLCTVLYLLIKQSNSGAMHRDLVDLITLCLFHSVIQTSTESPVCLPTGVCEGYLLPFTCPTYSLRSQWREVPGHGSDIVQSVLPFQPLLDLLSDSSADSLAMRRLQTLVRRNFRYSWSVACHRSPHAFVHHCLTMVGAWPDTEGGDIDTDLMDRCFRYSRDYTPYLSQLSLPCTDLSLFLLDHPEASLLLTLSSIQKATSHRIVAQALSAFLRSIEAHYYANSTTWLASGSWDSDRRQSWRWWFFAQLDRFLSVLPACSADFNLLTTLVDTIEHVGLRTVTPTVAKFGSSSKLCEWLISVFADTASPLVYCLLQPHVGIGETDSQRLAASKRLLIHQQLPRLLYGLTQQIANLVVSSNYFRQFWSHPAGHTLSPPGSPRDRRSCVPSVAGFFELCLQWAYRTMNEFASAPFADLVRLRLVLGVLCNLTCRTLWNSDFDRHWVVELLLVSTHVLSQFDAGREEASESFMGLGSLQLLLSVINQLVHHIGTRTTDLSSWVLPVPRTVGTNTSVGLDCLYTWTGADWLLRCTVYRSVEVRAITLCILSRICLMPDWARVFTSFQPSAETRTLLASRGRKLPPSGGRFWAIAISVLLDRCEACLCVVQALHLLTNLTTLPIHPRNSGIFLPPEHNVDDRHSVGPASLPPTQQASSSESPVVTNSGAAFQQPPVAPPTEDETEINTDSSTAEPSGPLPAGDRPTLVGHMNSDSSSVVDIRDLFNSDLETSELRENLTELLTYLRPWFNELFQPTYAALAEPQEGMESDSRFDQPWLIHTSSIPRDTLLPCCFDANSGIYLLGLPALQQLLIGQQLFSVFQQLLASYLPHPMLDPSRWNQLISVASATSTTTSAQTTNPAHPENVQTAEMTAGVDIPFFNDRSTEPVNVGDMQSSTATCVDLISRFCTPSFVSVACELFTNLMYYLPKFVISELSRLRINSLLMNIVDPNILEALLESNSTTTVNISVPQEVSSPHSPWFHTAAQLVSAFAMCLRVLRCQAAMHESFRLQLSSDARFLARLIRSLKHTDFADLLAPFWHELFALLTCLLLSPPSSAENSETNDLRLRLIVQPLSSYTRALVSIILHMLDRAETDVNKPHGELKPENTAVLCKHARSVLYFMTVVLSHHRPISANPVVNRLDSQSDHAMKTSVDTLTRRLMALATKNLDNVTSGQSRSIRQPFGLSVSPKLPVYVANYRRTLLATLRTLLGVSRSAKAIALQVGFLEELLFNMQLLQARLELCCMSATGQPPSSPTPVYTGFAKSSNVDRRQQAAMIWGTLSDELVAHFEILHNLIYMFPDAKKHAVEAGLPQLSQCLWPLALQDNRILHALLSLLTNFTADYPLASTALASSTHIGRSHPLHYLLSATDRTNSPTGRSQAQSINSSVDPPCTPTVTTGLSLVQSLCRLIQPAFSRGLPVTSTTGIMLSGPGGAANRSASGSVVPMQCDEEVVTHRFVFQLLANMMWAPEARCVLLKTKLLQRFVELDIRVLCKSRRGQFVLTLWLQLVTSLSFTKDGQQLLFGQLRLPEVLNSCAMYSKNYNRETALLVLRNLCTSTALKTKLLSGDTQMLSCIRDILLHTGKGMHSVYLISLAISAIGAIIYENQKVRVLIRSAGYLQPLTQLWSVCQHAPEFADLLPKVQALISQLQV
ncbi:hypothetical protein EG68_03574 [Paragonimus skrjabini miyazakii]|uniref:Rotatin N-terminal domain-containing protein n=1 Tax=Paragonimus skrjabini miyazakii TaxID=59628 RepID=A0A8S9YW43_9TREM|nr:hypothetical protein EG68_03574 [Paragonimus skrjabini miyazakii]